MICRCSGIVVRVGSRVRRFKPGDEVYARPADGRIGAFAEFMAINEADVAIKPRALTMEEAASIPLVGLTAWQALIERANLKQGQKVLIHAGSGGVGTFAIQLGKHVGATVATTTSTANVDLVRSLGADIVIDYKKEDFADVLRDYDVVLNSLDKVTLEKSLRVLKPGGQLISISGPPDAAFARSIGASWLVTMIIGALSYRITAKAKRRHAHYSFLFMRADGHQVDGRTFANRRSAFFRRDQCKVDRQSQRRAHEITVTNNCSTDSIPAAALLVDHVDGLRDDGGDRASFGAASEEAL